MADGDAGVQGAKAVPTISKGSFAQVVDASPRESSDILP